MTKIADAMQNLKEAELNALVDEAIEQGEAPLDILAELNQGMSGVGELFSSGTYYLSELVFSADVFKNAMAKLEPLLVGDSSASNLGKVVIGTVKNDIHDIGKNIVAALLKGTGFEVIDLRSRHEGCPCKRPVSGMRQGYPVRRQSAGLGFRRGRLSGQGLDGVRICKAVYGV
jgi:methanogenic corrinoid protein MtbC1